MQLSGKTVAVTGAAGVAGRAICSLLANSGAQVRALDVVAPTNWRELDGWRDFRRCDTRMTRDVQQGLSGADAVIHLAAWHCGHNPSVSDDAIFALNVDGTYNVVQSCRELKIQTFVFASSMAYGLGSVYSATKVIGEDLGRMLHHTSGASVALLRYHDFVPKLYLHFGEKLLRNGVDARDVASASVAATVAGLAKKYDVFQTIVHTNHGLTPEAREDFARFGPDWCESKLAGSKDLITKYHLDLPRSVEQHDLSQAKQIFGWEPQIGFVEFLRDLQVRVARGEDVRSLWAPGQIPV